jgi:transcriptional antiterminator RfaH
MQNFWCAAQLQPGRDGLALYFLRQGGFLTYAPRFREPRTVRGRKVVRTPLLFPNYAFVLIELQWHAVRWSPGVVRLVTNGGVPAAVPAAVIAALRARERDDLIELPARPPTFRPGDQVRVLQGPFAGLTGLYYGQKPRDRVAVLLQLLGGRQRTELPASAIEPVGARS